GRVFKPADVQFVFTDVYTQIVHHLCLSLFMQCSVILTALGYHSDLQMNRLGGFFYASVSVHSGWVQYPTQPFCEIMRFYFIVGKIQGWVGAKRKPNNILPIKNLMLNFQPKLLDFFNLRSLG
ncbi:hypothetical protein, partial [Conchiformibius kuhniae]|uniref:hypothetical protein n=1 Tax=Conchiformibius kuhniae TaxID=211502 RepID=UPI001B7F7A6A